MPNRSGSAFISIPVVPAISSTRWWRSGCWSGTTANIGQRCVRRTDSLGAQLAVKHFYPVLQFFDASE